MKLNISTLRGQNHDRVEVLLHAGFQILVDFIENESPDEIVDWESDPDHSHARKEMQELYDWWEKERPARERALDTVKPYPPTRFEEISEDGYYRWIEPDREKYAEYYIALDKSIQQDREWDEEDQRNLHRLVDIRQFLWT